MYRQMDIFDFIEKPPESVQEPLRTQFEQLFEKVKDPVCLCANCLCEFCVNNAEQSLDRVKLGEMQEPCFNCDECRVYDGDRRKQNQRKEECSDFVMSDYGAQRNRKRFRLIRGVKREGMEPCEKGGELMKCGECDYVAHNCRHQCMDLPEGMTCADCVHVKRCTSIFGAKPENTKCDFEPIRFKAASGGETNAEGNINRD